MRNDITFALGANWATHGAFVDAYNLFDSKDPHLDYFYASRLAGEPPEGVEDIHYHVFQPRSIRPVCAIFYEDADDHGQHCDTIDRLAADMAAG